MVHEDLKRIFDQVGPAPEREDAMLSAILSGEGGAQKGRKLSRLATASLAAALCVVLTLTALAVSPTLREALQNALGLFQPYSQEVEGLSVVDQGIEIRVVSALTDGNVAQVYYEIQDLTGDRLDEFTQDDLGIPIPVNYGGEDGPHWAAAGTTGIGGLVDYDPETRTILMCGAIGGDGPPAERLILGLDISEIQPGYIYEEPTIDPAWMAEGTLKSETLENGKSVLVPNQNPRSLDSDFFSLSSYGYGEDGVLHLLVKVEADDSEWNWGAHDVRYSGGYSRSETPQDYSRTYRYLQASNDIDWPDPLTRFQRDGITYCDMRTGITPADVAEGDVEWVDHFNAFLRTRPAIQGEWHLEVTTQPVETTAVDMTGSQTVLSGVAAQTLHLSVLGCTIESDPNGNAGTLGYPLTVYLTDGRTLPRNSSDGLFHVGGYAVNHWSFPEPVEPSQIAAIAIGQWYVPIENGVALPGHWLDEQP